MYNNSISIMVNDTLINKNEKCHYVKSENFRGKGLINLPTQYFD